MLFPASVSRWWILRLVGLLPAPVRVAVTAITGLLDCSMVVAPGSE